MPDIITNYDVLQSFNTPNALFWIVEYKNTDEINRYSVFRNECLAHPTDYVERLNTGVYRIWTVTPRDIPW